MILKTYPNKNIYGKYFLAKEAPDDEEITDDQPKPKRNVKVVSVKPNNRGKDFTQVGNDDTTSTDDTNDAVVDDPNAGVEQNDTNDNAEAQTEDTPVEETQPSEESNEEATEDKPDTGEDDNTDFTGTDTDSVDTSDDDTGEEGPDVGGDEDFTANSDDTTGDASDSNDTNQSADASADGKPTPPGVELDSTRKYTLYKEYMSLYNACDNYISKLENILKNNFEENQILRISVNNLREIKDILSDYMTIRFPINTYVQSLLFYQKMVVSVQLVFNLLKSIKSKSSK